MSTAEGEKFYDAIEAGGRPTTEESGLLKITPVGTPRHLYFLSPPDAQQTPYSLPSPSACLDLESCRSEAERVLGAAQSALFVRFVSNVEGSDPSGSVPPGESAAPQTTTSPPRHLPQEDVAEDENLFDEDEDDDVEKHDDDTGDVSEGASVITFLSPPEENLSDTLNSADTIRALFHSSSSSNTRSDTSLYKTLGHSRSAGSSALSRVLRVKNLDTGVIREFDLVKEEDTMRQELIQLFSDPNANSTRPYDELGNGRHVHGFSSEKEPPSPNSPLNGNSSRWSKRSTGNPQRRSGRVATLVSAIRRRRGDSSKQGPQSPLKDARKGEGRATLESEHPIINRVTACRISGKKSTRELTDVWMVDEISVGDNTAIWSIAISLNADMLACGFQSGIIRIYDIHSKLSSQETASVSNAGDESRILAPKPKWILMGHEATTVTLQWEPSASGRLLSASLDKTMRLWESKTGAQLIVLHCPDWPIAAAFHPTIKDRVFTGSLDATVQVWKLADPRKKSTQGKSGGSTPSVVSGDMIEYLRVSDLLTALSVSPNGKLLAVGMRFGRVSFFDAISLKFRCEVDCKNRHGRNSKGKKVTGLHWVADSSKLCVTTNDSRIRLIDLKDLSCSLKFKGHVNERFMLHAQIPPGQGHVVCASESSWICLWDTSGPDVPLTTAIQSKSSTKRKRPTNTMMESFKAFDELLTCCVTASDAMTQVVVSRLEGAPQYEGLRKATSVSKCQDAGNGVTSFGGAGNSAKNLVVVAASLKGRVRVFVNLGNAMRR